MFDSDYMLVLAALGYSALVLGIYWLARSYYRLPPEERQWDDDDRR